MTEAEVQLRLPAKPENVALVRQAVSGIADAIEVDPALVADIKTAVTEACNNVVLHAYAGDKDEGTMEIDASPGDGGVTIVVRDYGNGMQPQAPEGEDPSPGLGLPLIAALTDRFEISGGSERGIVVKMVFLFAEGAQAPESPNGVAGEAPEPPADDSTKAAGVAIRPGPLMAPVLGRLIAMLAARADFSLDRLSDAVLVTDALSANVSSYIPGRFALVTFQDGRRKIDLRVGPLVEDGAEELLRALELPGLERSLEELAEEVRVESAGADESGEYLFVRLSSDS